MIKWSKKQNNGLFLLACNDKTIKYWKVHEKKIKRPTRIATATKLSPTSPTPLSADITIPKLAHYQTITTATPKRIFSNAHGYHINSISMNSDGETFISADDLRIHLWNLNLSNECFNIVDVKPANLEELTEVITSSTFHPTHCSTFIYSSSRGSIRLADLRDSALCDHHAKCKQQHQYRIAF
jgi:serine/threonine-protein phosphatase 2A regulatory subunit B